MRWSLSIKQLLLILLKFMPYLAIFILMFL